MCLWPHCVLVAVLCIQQDLSLCVYGLRAERGDKEKERRERKGREDSGRGEEGRGEGRGRDSREVSFSYKTAHESCEQQDEREQETEAPGETVGSG